MGEDQASSSNNNTQTDDFLSKISKYKVIIPSIGIITGFLYVQGLFSPIMQRKFALTYLLRTGFILPIPSEAYINNGVFFLLRVLLLFFIAFIFLTGLYQFFQLLLGRFQFTIAKKIADRLLKFLSFFYFVFPPLSVIILYHLNENFDECYLFQFLWLYDTIFIAVLLGGYFLFRQQQRINSTNQFKPFIQLLGLLFIVTATLSSIPAIYYNGYVDQSIKIYYTLHHQAGLEQVKIYPSDKNLSPTGYYVLNISKDFFIGRNFQKQSIAIIPTAKIEKFEEWHAIEEKQVYTKYDLDLNEDQITQNIKGLNVSEAKAIFNSVIGYYTFRTGTDKNAAGINKDLDRIDASKVLLLVTENCQTNNYDFNFSPAVLNEKWQKNKLYNNNNLDDFYGFDLSFPEPKKGNRYDVYVHECWRGYDDQFLRFSLVKTEVNRKAGRWLIDAIEINEPPFKFRRAR